MGILSLHPARELGAVGAPELDLKTIEVFGRDALIEVDGSQFFWLDAPDWVLRQLTTNPPAIAAEASTYTSGFIEHEPMRKAIMFRDGFLRREGKSDEERGKAKRK